LISQPLPPIALASLAIITMTMEAREVKTIAKGQPLSW